MKRESMLRRLLSLCLALCMVVGLALPAFATDTQLTVTKVDNNRVSITPTGDREAVELEDEASAYTDKDMVRVSIILKKAGAIDAGYSVDGISKNSAAIRYQENLKKDQDKLVDKIIDTAGEIEVVWNMTLAANLISANVRYGQIEAIERLSGVEAVVIETQYEPDVVSTGAADPNMATSGVQTGSNLAWNAGYTGAGSRIAIIDTGLDTSHEAFAGDALLYSLGLLAAEKGMDEAVYLRTLDLLDAKEIEGVLSQLNAAKRYANLTAEDLYENAKVPFGFSYVDSELDETHAGSGSEHGSHVAGISAANAYVADGNGGYTDALSTTFVRGVAPDAQLLIMKVFGKRGGAYDSDYMVAIEDAIRLGADSVNLSLGSGNPGMSKSSTAAYQKIMENLEGCGVVVTMSAGNSFSWVESAENGMPYLYLDDISLQTNGTPGSFTNSLGVASVNNDGYTVPCYIGVNNAVVTYTETDYDNEPIATVAGELEYVYVDSAGLPEEFAAVNEIVPLKGKMVLCNRGTTSFYEKADAAAALGAAAVVIVNNTDGIINMDLTDYSYTAPVVSILQADGVHFKDADTRDVVGSVTYYTGTATVVTETTAGNYNSEYYTMSDFSSWGVPGSLQLKPEITAPGGNIYSVAGAYTDANLGDMFTDHASYEVMSGTSMAAPQVAGMAALVAQYIRENGLEDKTGLDARALAQSLLMSTAVPALEEGSDCYYSLLKQGSGIANVGKAVTANSYILMDKDATVSYADGKVKAELGDDPDRNGVYSFSFYINNLTDTDQRYVLNGEFFTQSAFSYSGALWMDTMTTDLMPTITWEVDGKAANDGKDLVGLDFDGDNDLDADDVQILLDYATGLVTEVDGAPQAAGKYGTLENFSEADLNDDGVVNSYDAYVLAKMLNEGGAAVPANGSAKVTVTVELSRADKRWLSNYPSGAYVEGFVYATELSSGEGEEGTEHSIPVLGFYGSWSEASMYDKGSYIEFANGLETRLPYLYSSNYQKGKYNGLLIQYDGTSDMYWYGGNPFFDETYQEDRNAISANADAIISKVGYTLIRNAAALNFVAIDSENGTAYVNSKLGEKNSAYFYVNGQAWKNTFYQTTVNFNAKGIPEGTALEVGLVAAPEYYVTDGSMNLADLEAGAYLTIPMVVDNTAPTVLSAAVDNVNKELKLEIQDNRHVAAVFLLDSNGQDVLTYAGSDPEQSAGDTVKYTLDLSNISGTNLIVQVYDYAYNAATYVVEETVGEMVDFVDSVTVTPNSAILINGNTEKLSATVLPANTVNKSVTWSSSDKNVATVASDGTVTAVGVGTAVITATSVADNTKSATATIEVIEVDVDLNTVVWDERGYVWYSEFNTSALPDYSSLTEEPWGDAIGSLTADTLGNVYAASLNDDDTSTLYKVNESDYSLEEIGTDAIFYADLAPAPSLGENYLMATYGPYLVIVDGSTGSYVGFWEYPEVLVGVTYAGSMYMTNYRQYADAFYILDVSGNVYQQMLMPYNGQYGSFYPLDKVLVNVGLTTEFSAYQSMYYDFDNELIFFSNFENEDINCVKIYAMDMSKNVFYLGSFEEGIWPAAGLDKTTVAAEEAAFGAELADAVLNEAAMAATGKIAADISVKGVVKGSTNAVVEVNGAEIQSSGEKTEALTVQITAKNATGEDVDSTNGVFTVSYDADQLELLKVKVAGDYISINDTEAENGYLTVGYVALDGIAAEDTIVTLYFDVKSSDLETVDILHRDVNDEEAYYLETLLLVDPAAIIDQVAEVEVADGESATITIEAEGKGLTYEWYYKNPNGTAFKKTGTFTGNTYNVKMTEARNGRQVYCVVTDKFGNAVQSDTFTLTLKPTVAAILTQPIDVVVEAGEKAVVTVVAEGDGLTYEWYYKNVGAEEFVKTDAFAGNRYRVVMNAARDGRQLYCVVTDKYGNSVTSNIVTIAMEKTSNLAIVIQPEDVCVAEGASAVVAFTAVGEGLTYEWYYRNAGADEFVKTNSFCDCRYSVVMNEVRDGRQVYCVVTDMYGNTVQTDIVTISMEK